MVKVSGATGAEARPEENPYHLPRCASINQISQMAIDKFINICKTLDDENKHFFEYR